MPYCSGCSTVRDKNQQVVASANEANAEIEIGMALKRREVNDPNE